MYEISTKAITLPHGSFHFIDRPQFAAWLPSQPAPLPCVHPMNQLLPSFVPTSIFQFSHIPVFPYSSFPIFQFPHVAFPSPALFPLPHTSSTPDLPLPQFAPPQFVPIPACPHASVPHLHRRESFAAGVASLAKKNEGNKNSFANYMVWWVAYSYFLTGLQCFAAEDGCHWPVQAACQA